MPKKSFVRPRRKRKNPLINRGPRPSDDPKPSISGTEFLSGYANRPVNTEEAVPDVAGNQLNSANFLARTKNIDVGGGTITPEIKAEMKAAGMGFSSPPPQVAGADLQDTATKRGVPFRPQMRGMFAEARRKNQQAMEDWKEAQSVHKKREEESRKGIKETRSYKEQLEKQKSDYESQWAGKEFGQSMRDSYKAEIEKRRAANKAKKANKANKDDKDNKDEPKEEDK